MQGHVAIRSFKWSCRETRFVGLEAQTCSCPSKKEPLCPIDQFAVCPSADPSLMCLFRHKTGSSETKLKWKIVETIIYSVLWVSVSSSLLLSMVREGRRFLDVMFKWLFLFCTTSNLKRFHRASRIWLGSFKVTSEPIIQQCWSCPQRSHNTNALSTNVCNACSEGMGKYEFYMPALIFTVLGLGVHVWFHRKNSLLCKRCM